MKKAIITAVILAAVVGGLYFFGKKEGKQPAPPRVDKNGNVLKGLRVVQDDSLTGWLNRKQTVECQLTTEQGEVKMLVKNDIVRIEGVPYSFGDDAGQAKGFSLTDGDWVYMWGNGQGTKINLADLQSTMTEEQKFKASDYSWKNLAEQWTNQYKYECREKKLSDNLFAPPDDVTFVDLTPTLKKAQEAAGEFQQKLPGKVINQEDIEAQLESLQEESQ